METPTIKPKLTNIELDEVLGIGAALGAPQIIGEHGVPYAVVPTGYKLETLEKTLPQPLRPKGTIQLMDAQSFARYVNKHKDAPETADTDKDDIQTVVLVDLKAKKFRAVFDHHASDDPGWGEHIAQYDCPVSPEWTTWQASNGRQMDQETFAFFIEQNMLDIVEPVGATMLQVVTTLKSTKNVAFDAGIVLSNGQQQLKYHEVQKDAAGENGQLTIPEEIALGIPVFIGGANYKVTAKFRYRISGTKLCMWYDLLRPHKIEEDALNKVVAQITETTGITPYAASWK